MTVDAAATAAVGDDIVIHLNDNPERHVHLRAAPSQYSLPPPFSTLLCLLFSCTILYTSYIIINNNSKIFFFKKGPKNRGRRWIIYKNISRRRRASTAFRSSYFSSVKCKFWFDFLFVSNFFLKKYVEMVCTKRKAKKKKWHSSNSSLLLLTSK